MVIFLTIVFILSFLVAYVNSLNDLLSGDVLGSFLFAALSTTVVGFVFSALLVYF